MSVRILNYKHFRILIPNYRKIGTMPFRFDESHISMGAWENVLEISDGDWMWQKERERERVRKPLSLYTQLIIIWSVFWFYVYRFAIWFPFMFNHFSSCFLSRCFFPIPSHHFMVFALNATDLQDIIEENAGASNARLGSSVIYFIRNGINNIERHWEW